MHQFWNTKLEISLLCGTNCVELFMYANEIFIQCLYTSSVHVFNAHNEVAEHNKDMYYTYYLFLTSLTQYIKSS